jgi:hypothetical protein
MHRPSLFAVLCCLALCFVITAPVWGQGSSTVYFSTGSGSSSVIYSLNTANGALTALVSTSSADYEGLVVLPDNTGQHPYLVYACDTANSRVVRFDPSAAAPITPEVIYSGGLLTHPQCGRGTSNGDLLVTSSNSGKNGGWWSFAGIANLGLGSGGGQVPKQLFVPKANSSVVGEGLAMKNVGDLLIVDHAGNQILRSSGPISSQFSGQSSYSTATPFITGLSGPVGVARKTSGEIFVTNQANPSLMKFNSQGQNGTTCVSFQNKNTPAFLQMTLDDTLYVGNTQQNGKGQVLVVNPQTCAVTNTFTSSNFPPVVGIALPPTSAALTASSNDQSTFTFNVGDSSLFQVVTGGSCTSTPSATATEAPPASLLGSIGTIPDLPNGGTPAVDLWADGFEITFDANFVQCQPLLGNPYLETISTFLDPSVVTAGTVAYCDNGACDTVDLIGAYPLGGLLPADPTYTGGTRVNSKFFDINATSSMSGQFCGYQSPLSAVDPPGVAATFSSGGTISVKFKLASSSGACNKGPYIQTAVALISVAQLCAPGSSSGDLICAPKGQALLTPSNLVTILPEGSSTPTPPIFKYGNNQYQFSLSLKGYPPGIYSLTTTFESGEETDKTILFQVQ